MLDGADVGLHFALPGVRHRPMVVLDDEFMWPTMFIHYIIPS
jgi:hypothetical protein